MKWLHDHIVKDASYFGIDLDLLKELKDLYKLCIPIDFMKLFYKNNLNGVSLVIRKMVGILTIVLTIYCPTEISFSDIRRILRYLRNGLSTS